VLKNGQTDQETSTCAPMKSLPLRRSVGWLVGWLVSLQVAKHRK